MGANKVSVLVHRSQRTVPEFLLSLLAAVVAWSLYGAGYNFYHRDFEKAAWGLAVGLSVAFVFYRKRKVFLIMYGSLGLIALLLLALPFHPSIVGFASLFGSVAVWYLVLRWRYKKFPYVSHRDERALFHGEVAMAEENARMEALARGLNKPPYVPWLFR